MELKDRLAILEEQHQYQHKLVEAAEAENAPEQYVHEMKKKKLALKDEISILKKQLEIKE